MIALQFPHTCCILYSSYKKEKVHAQCGTVGQLIQKDTLAWHSHIKLKVSKAGKQIPQYLLWFHTRTGFCITQTTGTESFYCHHLWLWLGVLSKHESNSDKISSKGKFHFPHRPWGPVGSWPAGRLMGGLWGKALASPHDTLSPRASYRIGISDLSDKQMDNRNTHSACRAGRLLDMLRCHWNHKKKLSYLIHLREQELDSNPDISLKFHFLAFLKTSCNFVFIVYIWKHTWCCDTHIYRTYCGLAH